MPEFIPHNEKARDRVPVMVRRARQRRRAHRPASTWPGLALDPLNPGRAPEESYRDYLFRTAIR
jgi:hypothetical protein